MKKENTRCFFPIALKRPPKGRCTCFSFLLSTFRKQPTAEEKPTVVSHFFLSRSPLGGGPQLQIVNGLAFEAGSEMATMAPMAGRDWGGQHGGQSPERAPRPQRHTQVARRCWGREIVYLHVAFSLPIRRLASWQHTGGMHLDALSHLVYHSS